MKRLQICLFLILSASMLVFAQDSTMKVIGPGFKYHSVTKPGPYSIKILEIDLTQSANTLETVLARDVMGTGFERTTSMAKRNNRSGHVVIGAINGDYFGISYPDSAFTFINNPQIIKQEYVMGKTVSRSSFGINSNRKPILDILSFSGIAKAKNDSVFSIKSVNQPRGTNHLVLFSKYVGNSTKTNQYGVELKIEPIDPMAINGDIRFKVIQKMANVGNMSLDGKYVLSGHGTAASFVNSYIAEGDTIKLNMSSAPDRGIIQELIGGGPRLITNGTRPSSFVGVEGFSESHVNTQHPRTAVGMNADSTKVFFLTVDGRQPTISVGMSCAQLADYMISIGCHHGINLDGGGSTTMVVRGSIVNSPSDGSERSCGNALLAIANIPSSQVIDSFYLQPENIIIDTTQTKKININAIDLWGYPIEVDPAEMNWQILGINGFIDSLGFFHPTSSGSGKIIGEINNLKDTINVIVLSNLLPTWQLSSATNNLPTWFSTTGSTERGMAYGFINGNPRLYVVNRPNITILDPATGDNIGNISTATLTGGTYLVSDIETSEDGKIFAANLTTSASTTPFKVYKWDSETAVPQVVIEYTAASAVRLGDKITVVGSFTDNTAQVFAAANSSNKVYKWTMSNGAFNQIPLEITLSDITNSGTNPAVYPKGLGNSNFFYNGNSMRPTEYTLTGTKVATVPVSSVDSRSSAMRYISTSTKKYLIVFQYGFPNENAVVLDVTKGLDSALVIETSPVLGANTNTIGASGDIAYRHFDTGRYIYYVLSTNNGIGAYQLVGDVIPVELTSFNVNADGNSVILSWTTATETNNNGFAIERKIIGIGNDSEDWMQIAFIKGNGTSLNENSYSYSDRIGNISYDKISYRLKQIDFDGTVSYSKEVEVTSLPTQFSMSQNYPNPFNPKTVINYQLPADSKVSIKVFDILGKEIKDLVNEFQKAGRYEVSFDGNSLASGIYICRLTASDYTKTIKMSLLK